MQQLRKMLRFMTKPWAATSESWFLKATGNMSLPLASTLHSYVPIMFNKDLRNFDVNIDWFYHILPLYTTF